MRPRTVVPQPLEAVADRITETVGAASVPGVPALRDSASPLVGGVTLRAQETRRGDLFAALPGAHAHGADHAATALAQGAAAVLTDAAGAARPAVRDAGVPVLVHDDPRAALGPASALVYGDPSTRPGGVGVLGVTGTSGKTTTVYLLEAALAAAGATTGLIGTIETRIGGERAPSAFTTPEAPDLQALLAVMVERGVSHAAMEVSSHALALERVAGTRFAVGAFTNLSPEHLDFHADMEAYFAAKARLFDGRAAAEVVCADARWGRRLVTDGTVTVAPDLGAPDLKVSDPTGTATDWRAADVVAHPDGTQTFRALGPGVALPVTLHLPGAFNVVNALLALACGTAAGFDPGLLAGGLATVRVPGRMQRIEAGQDFLAVVDYAHKPAAVGALLTALRTQARGPRARGRVLTVLGCGGDRDRAKRPVMGRLAAELSDALWVTDDNPRSENPATIRAAVLEGARAVPDEHRAEIHEQGDRRAAIGEAVAAARPGDVVAVAGKGHETGQKVGDTTLPFSDADEVRGALDRVLGGGRR